MWYYVNSFKRKTKAAIVGAMLAAAGAQAQELTNPITAKVIQQDRERLENSRETPTPEHSPVPASAQSESLEQKVGWSEVAQATGQHVVNGLDRAGDGLAYVAEQAKDAAVYTGTEILPVIAEGVVEVGARALGKVYDGASYVASDVAPAVAKKTVDGIAWAGGKVADGLEAGVSMIIEDGNPAIQGTDSEDPDSTATPSETPEDAATPRNVPEHRMRKPTAKAQHKRPEPNAQNKPETGWLSAMWQGVNETWSALGDKVSETQESWTESVTWEPPKPREPLPVIETKPIEQEEQRESFGLMPREGCYRYLKRFAGKVERLQEMYDYLTARTDLQKQINRELQNTEGQEDEIVNRAISAYFKTHDPLRPADHNWKELLAQVRKAQWRSRFEHLKASQTVEYISDEQREKYRPAYLEFQHLPAYVKQATSAWNRFYDIGGNLKIKAAEEFQEKECERAIQEGRQGNLQSVKTRKSLLSPHVAMKERLDRLDTQVARAQTIALTSKDAQKKAEAVRRKNQAQQGKRQISRLYRMLDQQELREAFKKAETTAQVAAEATRRAYNLSPSAELREEVEAYEQEAESYSTVYNHIIRGDLAPEDAINVEQARTQVVRQLQLARVLSSMNENITRSNPMRYLHSQILENIESLEEKLHQTSGMWPGYSVESAREDVRNIFGDAIPVEQEYFNTEGLSERINKAMELMISRSKKLGNRDSSIRRQDGKPVSLNYSGVRQCNNFLRGVFNVTLAVEEGTAESLEEKLRMEDGRFVPKLEYATAVKGSLHYRNPWRDLWLGDIGALRFDGNAQNWLFKDPASFLDATSISLPYSTKEYPVQFVDAEGKVKNVECLAFFDEGGNKVGSMSKYLFRLSQKPEVRELLQDAHDFIKKKDGKEVTLQELTFRYDIPDLPHAIGQTLENTGAIYGPGESAKQRRQLYREVALTSSLTEIIRMPQMEKYAKDPSIVGETGWVDTPEKMARAFEAINDELGSIHNYWHNPLRKVETVMNHPAMWMIPQVQALMPEGLFTVFRAKNLIERYQDDPLRGIFDGYAGNHLYRARYIIGLFDRLEQTKGMNSQDTLRNILKQMYSAKATLDYERASLRLLGHVIEGVDGGTQRFKLDEEDYLMYMHGLDALDENSYRPD